MPRRRSCKNWGSFKNLNRISLAVASGLVLAACAGTSAGSKTSTTPSTPVPTAGFAAPTSGYVVYWDQDEEEDYYASANGTQGQLITPWDPNGQMCLLNDGTGRFVVGYDPTNPSQHNPGAPRPIRSSNLRSARR